MVYPVFYCPAYGTLTLLNKTFILANRVDPSKMLHFVAAHHGLPCFLLPCLLDAMYQLTLLNKTFIVANRVDPSGNLHSAAAHIGLPCFLLSCLYGTLYIS